MESLPSLTRVLREAPIREGEYLTSAQITQLTGLTNREGEPFLSLQDPNHLVYEVMIACGRIGFDKVFTYLASAVDEMNTKNVIFKSPVFYKEQQRYIADLARLRDPAQTSAGIYRCTKCGSMNTEHSRQQMRSADEPESTIVVCRDCNTRKVYR